MGWKMRTDFLRGSWVALVTPFTEDGKIDYKAFEKLIAMQVAARTDGLLICGTTGEAVTLSFDEKKSLMQAAKELTAGKVPLMFGSGGNDTRAVVDLTSKAASLGADAVLVVTPYYNKPPQDGLKIHYRAVSESTDLPVILYNVPGRTGCNMLPDTVLSLSEIPNIVAVKEASGNLEQVMEIIRRAPENFALFSGDDALNLPIMACGGVGTISVTANVAPALCAQFQAACAAGDLATARTLNDRLYPLHYAMFKDASPGPVKYALSRVHDWMTGELRLPLVPCNAAAREAVDSALVASGLL